MNDQLKEQGERIKELNDKATQILIFLSFAMVAAVTLRSTLPPGCSQNLVTCAMRWWTGAIFPVILCVLPVKDILRDKVRWYPRIRWGKFALLCLAVVFIIGGAVQFYRAL